MAYRLFDAELAKLGQGAWHLLPGQYCMFEFPSVNVLF